MTLLKLKYVPKTLSIYLKLNWGTLKQIKKIPPDLIDKTHKQMISEIESKNFTKYTIHIKKLSKFIELSHQPKFMNLSDDLELQVTLATGLLNIPWISLKKDQGFIKLSAKVNPEELINISAHTFFNSVKLLLGNNGIKGSPCSAQITSIYNRLRDGMEIVDLPLEHARSSKMSTDGMNRDYEFFLFENRTQLAIIIYNINGLLKKGASTELFNSLRKELTKLKKPIKVWKNEMISDIMSATHGIERFGLDLPVVILAATSNSLSQNLTSPVAQEIDYPGKGMLQLEGLKGKVKVFIKEFSTENYENTEINFNTDWFDKEIQRLRIKRIQEKDKFRIYDKLKRKLPLNNLLVAEAKLPEPAKQPQIILAQSISGDHYENEELSSGLRERYGHVKMVLPGEHIADLVYQQPPVIGIDVFGEPISPPDPHVPHIEMTNVKLKGRAFFAECKGVVKISDLTISVDRTMIHKGNVDLASGNISYDGPIIIEGNVESGGVVTGREDIYVQGNVSGHIYCRGSLTVNGGIVGETGIIRCRGDIETNFIENTNIFCHGSIRVDKSILTSKVRCLGRIDIENEDSILAGCTVMVGDRINTFNLGFNHGTPTIIHLGCNWIYEEKSILNKKRQTNFEEELEKSKIELREMVRKNKSNSAKKIKELKDKIQQKVTKLKNIVVKLKSVIKDINANKTYNDQSNVRIRGLCQSTCKIYFGNKEITFPNGLTEVMISSKKTGKSHITDLKIVLEKEKKRKEIKLDYVIK